MSKKTPNIQINSPQSLPKKPGIIARICKWMMYKTIKIVVIIALLAGAVWVLYNKFPNLLMALLTEKISWNNSNSTEEPLPPVTQDQVIHMKITGDKVELDGRECKSTADLPALMNEIQQKYANKKIIINIKYTENDSFVTKDKYKTALRNYNVGIAENDNPVK